jgi:DNA recombination protein RmuC
MPAWLTPELFAIIIVGALLLFLLISHRSRPIQAQIEIARAQEREKASAEKIDALSQFRDDMENKFKLLSLEVLKEQSQTFGDTNKEKLEVLLGPLKREIEQFKTDFKSDGEKRAEQRGAMEQLVGILKAETSKVRDEAGNLARALKGQAQTQGAWGEMILSTVLEKAGLREGEEFVVQESHTLEGGERLRPDVVVNFPDGRKLVVDSKVSLVAFERCVNCDDEAERAAHLNDHLKSVRGHIKGLSEKDYARLYGGVDFVILFVPVEGALSLAIQNDPNIQTEAVERGVMIASPNTLLMGMRTVQNVWMREYQNRNVTKIADRAGKLYDKFVGFTEDLEKVGASLNNARSAYEDARSKLASGRGNLVRQAEELKKLGAKTSKKLPDPLLALGEDGDDDGGENEVRGIAPSEKELPR